VAHAPFFFVRGVVRRRRAFQGLKPLSEEIGRNVHAYSFRFFSDKVFDCQPKNAHQWVSSFLTAHQHKISHSVLQKTPISTSNEEIGARSHDLRQRTISHLVHNRSRCLSVSESVQSKHWHAPESNLLKKRPLGANCQYKLLTIFCNACCWTEKKYEGQQNIK